MSERLIDMGESEVTGNFYQDLADSIEIQKKEKVTEELCRSAMTEFRQSLDGTPMGPATLHQFDMIVSKLENDSGVDVNRGEDSEFVVEDRRSLLYYDGEITTNISIKIGMDTIKLKTEALTSALEGIGVQLEPDKAQTLATEWVMWHELGHAVELAADLVETNEIGMHPVSQLVGANTEREADDDLSVLGQPASVVEGIESERFAEGLAQKLLREKLVADNIVNPEAQDELINRTRDVWRSGPAYQRAKDLQIKWNEEEVDATQPNRIINQQFSSFVDSTTGDSQKGLAGLGYANFYDDEGVGRILALTS